MDDPYRDDSKDCDQIELPMRQSSQCIANYSDDCCKLNVSIGDPWPISFKATIVKFN